MPNARNADPNRVIRDATLQLNELRQAFKDNPDISREITGVEQELSRLRVGDISSQELTNRINRTVLPNLESLELQLRKEVESHGDGQVRSGATDRIPAGYADAVAEYSRKLSKGK